jgi:hypothetical protein
MSMLGDIVHAFLELFGKRVRSICVVINLFFGCSGTDSPTGAERMTHFQVVLLDTAAWW